MESTLSATQTTPASAVDEKVKKSDGYIWGIYITLVLFSIVELYSASSREITSSSMGVFGPIIRHGLQLLVGLGIILGIQRVHYSRFYLAIPALAIISIVAMICVMFFGEIVNGARRSLNLYVFSLQPAEFIKLSAAACIALIMSRSQTKHGVTDRGLAISATLVLVFGAMLLPQGLTNTLLLMAISGSMMIISGARFSKLMIVLFVYVVVLLGFMGVSHLRKESAAAKAEQIEQVDPRNEVERSGTWKKRLERFSNSKPKYLEEINAENRQEMYSYMAQANGGVKGVFPGNSRETARLPLAFSDFIYAIIVEDLGLWGGLGVLFLYLSLLARASAIASKCTRAFPALLVIGMAVMIVLQAISHMAIVTGASPVSGQPLPLISKGGTSILVTSIAIGVMLSVSRHAVRTGGKKKDIRTELEALPDDVRAENPTQL